MDQTFLKFSRSPGMVEMTMGEGYSYRLVCEGSDHFLQAGKTISGINKQRFFFPFQQIQIGKEGILKLPGMIVNFTNLIIFHLNQPLTLPATIPSMM